MFSFYELAGVPIPSDNGSEFLSFLLRVVLFLLFLLAFVFTCGYAWRTLPGLKAILPNPPEKRLKAATQITLAEAELEEEDDEQDARPTLTPVKPSTPPISETVPVFNTYRDSLDAALTDNQAGAVVRAASEPGTQTPGPIIILRRPEEN